MNDIPEYARIFRNTWIDQGQNPESATMESVHLPYTNDERRAVFINTFITGDWGSAYFLAEKAMNAAVIGLRSFGMIGTATIPQFSAEPAYIVSEAVDGLITIVWVNALTALDSEEAWNKAIADGKAEAAILDQAKKAGDSADLLRVIAEKDKLRREGKLPSFNLNSLKADEGPVADLLRRWNIRG